MNILLIDKAERSNYKTFYLTAFILLCLLSLFLNNEQIYASQSPRFLGSEKKFRAYIYNPNAVYRYVGHYYYQAEIIFEKDETINTVSMGNPSLWLFETLGNTLYLKPVEDNAETNMTIITSKRTYHFELTAREAESIDDENLIFAIKFIYPDQEDKNIMQFPTKTPSDAPDMRDPSIYNFNYEFTGNPSIAPLKIFDNGEFTYFQFSSKNAEIPAIFHVDSDGYESLVNFRFSDDYIIVERVSAQFTLRNGNDIVCVYNNNMLKEGMPSTQIPTRSQKLNVVPDSTPDFIRKDTY